jgi:hypothetical protein
MPGLLSVYGVCSSRFRMRVATHCSISSATHPTRCSPRETRLGNFPSSSSRFRCCREYGSMVFKRFQSRITFDIARLHEGGRCNAQVSPSRVSVVQCWHMSQEQWRPVVGLEDFYEVSDLGRVRSRNREMFCHFCRNHGVRKGKVLKGRLSSEGYLQVSIGVDRRSQKNVGIHRLVALAFLPNPEGKLVVNHKDRNRQNNELLNLEWVTVAENVQHWRDDEKRLRSLEAA